MFTLLHCISYSGIYIYIFSNFTKISRSVKIDPSLVSGINLPSHFHISLLSHNLIQLFVLTSLIVKKKKKSFITVSICLQVKKKVKLLFKSTCHVHVIFSYTWPLQVPVIRHPVGDLREKPDGGLEIDQELHCVELDIALRARVDT